jgi:glycosyltransferase involved in cell wall biosynthesis
MTKISSSNSKPKILFIGVGESSHARSFTELFIDDFDVRFFAMPTYVPPNDWPVKTYTTCPTPPMNMDPQNRINLYPTPEDTKAYVNHIAKRSPLTYFLRRIYEEFSSSLKILFRRRITLEDILPPQIQMRSSSLNHWLIEIIESWQPDIIHTCGIDRGILLQDSWRRIKGNISFPFKWILQVRGASDITLRRNLPDPDGKLFNCLDRCDWIIGDNKIELEHIATMGINKSKFIPFCPIPGSGGIDHNPINHGSKDISSSREIVWPKAYISMQSLSYPVLEAIKIAWDQIQPCTIHILPIDEPTRKWFYLLPEEIRNNCEIYDYTPREKLLELMKECRVMLAPALFDGIPNVLYEAMIAGALPIVSPLKTIKSMVNENNVLFAENMNSIEIANKLISAMTNDVMVSKMIKNNFEFVKVKFNRQTFKSKLVNFYNSILS